MRDPVAGVISYTSAIVVSFLDADSDTRRTPPGARPHPQPTWLVLLPSIPLSHVLKVLLGALLMPRVSISIAWHAAFLRVDINQFWLACSLSHSKLPTKRKACCEDEDVSRRPPLAERLFTHIVTHPILGWIDCHMNRGDPPLPSAPTETHFDLSGELAFKSR